MEPGKRFERKFKESLELLGGFAHRIEDGGRYSLNDQPGDFYYFSPDGIANLIECKATREKSFPFKLLRDSQVASLLAFERVSRSTRSWVAVNYYGKNVAKDNRCFLVPINGYVQYAAACGRKSLPVFAAGEIGTECPKVKGNIWALPL